MFYNKASAELIYDLINSANPGLSTPVTSSNTRLGTPSVISVVAPSVSDTKVNVAAKPNGFFIANLDLTYRRIDLGAFFKGVNPEIRKYSSAAANASPYTLYNLLADLNSKYGTAFSSVDFDDMSFPAATDNYYTDRTCKITVTAKASSPAFKGSFDLRWVYAKPLVSNILAIKDLAARVYPGGNTFDSNHKYILNSEAIGYDFTDQLGNLQSAAFNAGVSIGNASYTTQQQAVVDLLNSFTGKTYTIGSANQGLAFGLYGAVCKRVDLPDATVPELLATYYNTAVIITMPTNNPWGVGSLYLCYNK